MNNLYTDQEQDNDSINLLDLIVPYLRNWKSYVICVTLCVIAAVFYLKNATPIYQVSTSFILKDEDKGGSIGALGDFEDLGLFGGGGSKVDNELEIIKSRFLIKSTIEQLKTNVEYWEVDGLKKNALYTNSPFIYKSVDSKVESFSTPLTFSVRIINETEFSILFDDANESKNYSWGKSIHYNNIEFILIPQIDFLTESFNKSYKVILTPIDLATEFLQKRISFNAASKKNDVIKLTLKDASKQRAKDILNTLVEIYNDNAITDKKEVNLKTAEFIGNRLELIKKELVQIEESAEGFKQQHRLLDIETQSTLFSERISKSKDELFKTETQIRLAKFLSEHLLSSEDEYALIPINIGLNNPGLENLSASYNEIIIERNRIEQSTNSLNPVIKNINSQLKDLKNNINLSLVNYIQTLKITRSELKGQEQLINSKIASIPLQERQYRSIARQQELKESLYLFLLQKREETSLSLAATSSNSKIIDKAYGSNKPVAPVTKIILLVGFLIGLILPTLFIYIRELLDTKIHNKKEFESLIGDIPILGDIPTSDDKNSRIKTTSDRSSSAEAFRILTTNLNFLLGKKKDESKIICITSTIVGEGKTFVSTNLSTVLSFSKKKTLLIGADVRNPKMADYFTDSQQHLGLTNYLSDTSMNKSEIIITQSDNVNLDVIFSGIIPPNPVELLSSDRFAELINDLKQQYDYIILDTAPVSLVTDTLLISKFADMFIYVTRAEYLDKRMLEVPKNLFKQDRLPNMAMVLNDIDVKKGYGYGYGYGYGEKKDKKWYSIFSS